MSCPLYRSLPQLTVDHLMMAIKQLSSAELHEFMQQLAAWQQHNGQQVEEEAALLARIEENLACRLPHSDVTGSCAVNVSAGH